MKTVHPAIYRLVARGACWKDARYVATYAVPYYGRGLLWWLMAVARRMMS